MPKPTAARPVRRSLLAALAALATTAVLLTSQGSASAPQPASLTTPLGSSTGATAQAVLLNSPQVRTTVLFWPNTWKAGGSHIAAGTPCSNVALVAGSVTTKTIQVMGPNRRCI